MINNPTKPAHELMADFIENTMHCYSQLMEIADQVQSLPSQLREVADKVEKLPLTVGIGDLTQERQTELNERDQHIIESSSVLEENKRMSLLFQNFFKLTPNEVEILSKRQDVSISYRFRGEECDASEVIKKVLQDVRSRAYEEFKEEARDTIIGNQNFVKLRNELNKVLDIILDESLGAVDLQSELSKSILTDDIFYLSEGTEIRRRDQIVIETHPEMFISYSPMDLIFYLAEYELFKKVQSVISCYKLLDLDSRNKFYELLMEGEKNGVQQPDNCNNHGLLKVILQMSGLSKNAE